MSFAAVRGEPTAAQRYLDGVLAAAAAALGLRDPRRVSMPQLLHHCMRANPNFVFMTNGSTGVKSTNKQLLELAVPLARALAGAGLAGRRVMLVARDHERTVAVYLALNFAGVVPFMTDPTSTKFELQYYMELVEPALIFTDAATHDGVLSATESRSDAPPVLAIHTDQLLEYARGHAGHVDDYRVADSEPETTLLLLPTSGSTGMPKAARYCNRGQVNQLATTWMHFKHFPAPTKRAMVLTTPQWGTFTLMLTTSCVYSVELLMSPEHATVQHVLHMMENYKPTWTFLGPPFAKQLLREAEVRHFASLQTLLTLGSQATKDLIAGLKAKMPASSHVVDGYGMTELHGFITLTDPGAPLGCNGPVTNILHYKLVKDNGEEAAIGEEGELYVKGDSIITGYHKNEAELAASMEGEWLRTGDEFTRDAQHRLYYRRRIKFSFKYDNKLVSPEELEVLIGRLPFVADAVVCDSAQGPAAAVVLRPEAPAHSDARQQIHELIDSTVSEHKRLRGGVAFVAALPRTHSGKTQRGKCRDMVHQLIQDGLCY